MITVPLLALLDQFASDFPGFCNVGTRHNQKIDLDAKGFIAVTKSVHLLGNLTFQAILVDEAHHPLPPGMPKYDELYRFSATQADEPDFRYTMGQAIDDGVLCDYDITVPALTQQHAYVCLADLLLKQAGRFRRVLAYCNSVAEAKKFKMVVEELGLAAWHINARTSRKGRMAAIEKFSGNLTKPVHVMVTVEVLGEGINIPNADTCMFVEPRNSYRSVIQAIGRVLRCHPGKTLAHIVLPAVAVPANAAAGEASSKHGHDPHLSQVQSAERHELQHKDAKTLETAMEGTPLNAEAQQEQLSTGFATASEASGGQVRQRLTSSMQNSVPFPPPSNMDEGVEKSVGTGREGTTELPDSERSAEADPEPPAQAGSKVKRKLAISEAASTYSQPALDATERTLQVGHLSSSHLRPSLGQQKLLPFHKGHSKALDASGALRPRSTCRTRATVSRAGQVLQGLADHNSSAKTSAKHKPNSFQGMSIASTDARDSLGRDGTYWRAGIELSSQTKDKGRMVSTEGRRDISNASSAGSLVEQPAAGAEQNGVIRRAQLRSPRVSDAGELLSCQLERFLSLLVQADPRLLGCNVGHRIQLVDCRLATDGELGSWAEVVYRQLTALLQQTDPWEQRLQSVEEFAAATGKLPRHGVKDVAERALGVWLYNSGVQLSKGHLRANRLQRLLNSSSLLVQQRVEGWLSQDPDCAFKRGCLRLKQHVELTGKVPSRTSDTSRLFEAEIAKWLSSQRNNGMLSNPERRAMLLSTHPLVAELLAGWDRLPCKVKQGRWQVWLQKLVHFIRAESRLPKYFEKELYSWFTRQLLRLEQLPRQLVDQLRNSHPLIAAAVDAKEAEKSWLERPAGWRHPTAHVDPQLTTLDRGLSQELYSLGSTMLAKPHVCLEREDILYPE